MPPRLRRASEEEVRRRWAVLSLEQRQELTCFDDGALVERIKAALQALFEKQQLMNELGLTLTGAQDPFAASTLFTTAFEFTWQIARSTRNPDVVMMDPLRMPVMAMKARFVQSDGFFADLASVLPDLLADRNGRVPLPRPRWKELWSAEPVSICAMEKQLCKLVEQALWALGSDPAYEVPEEEPCQTLADCMGGDCVQFESWMLNTVQAKAKTGDTGKKRKKKKQQRASVSHALEPTMEEGDLEGHAASSKEGEKEESLGMEEVTAPPSRSDLCDLPSRSDLCDLGAEEEEEALSDDESVGLGTLNTTAAEDMPASEVSRGATASSTPALATPAIDPPSPKTRWTNWRPPAKPAAWRPPGSSQAMHPTQLVCYIWNQTSQFESDLRAQRSAADSPQRQRAETAPQAPAPVFARGQWTGQAQPGSHADSPVLAAVVKNTFVDIDDPKERHGSRSRGSRSLSPSLLSSRDDLWL